jgi:hypothetical protein
MAIYVVLWWCCELCTTRQLALHLIHVYARLIIKTRRGEETQHLQQRKGSYVMVTVGINRVMLSGLVVLAMHTLSCRREAAAALPI